ncbi:hypothetical protein ACLKA6_017356 [Drosophila palustris]
MRLVRSKLRKSTNIVAEDHHHHHENEDDHHHHSPTVNFGDTETAITNNCSPAVIKEHPHVTFVRTSGVSPQTAGHAEVTTALAEWTFPPKAPVPHIYHINPEMLVANDKIGFKGFRKQFSGRFKRLVARKPEPAPVIPPELKPQLKTIYVY